MADEQMDTSYWQRLREGRATRRGVLAGGITALTGGIAFGLVDCSSSNNNTAANNRAAVTVASGAGTASPTAAASRAAGTPSAGAGTASAGGAAAAAAVAPTADAKLKTGGTVQIRIVGTANLDPVANTTYRSQWLASFHYARLFRFAASADPQVTLSRVPVPDLVEKYEISGDGLQYTMHLRQGVMYHPPLSRALTSADVAASYQYFTTNPKNSNSGVYKGIVDSLSTPDDGTLVWKLTSPYAPFLNKLANTQYLWILSKDAVDGKIDPSQQAIGTGPWIFVSSTPTAFTWKKNPDYMLKGLPYADQAILNIIPDTSTQEAQFQAGRLDVLSVPPADIDAIKKAVPKAQMQEYDPDGMSLFFFSNVSDSSSPFNDVRMRQAASLAVDRQGLIDAIYNGRAVWDNLINPGLGKWYLDPQGKDIGESGKWFKHDPQQAKQLIAAAGHSDTQLKYIYPNNAYGDLYNATADAIRGMLSDAGFKLQVVTVDYLKDWIDPTHGYAFAGLPPNSIGYALQTPFTDPDDFLTGMLTKDGNRNAEFVDDADLTALVKKQQVELDENKRLQEVYDVQRAHAEKMYYPPIIYTKAYSFEQPWVQSFFVADDYNFGTEQFAYCSVNNR